MKIIDVNSPDYIIGQNIARLRKEHGLSQADMEDFQISRAYLGRVELGYHSLTVDKLSLIARALGIPMSAIFKDENGEDII